jgi:hypothetical protein
VLLGAVRVGLVVLEGAGDGLEDVRGGADQADPGGAGGGLEVSDGDRCRVAVVIVRLRATATQADGDRPLRENERVYLTGGRQALDAIASRDGSLLRLPSFTVERMPSPRSLFGTYVTPVPLFPVNSEKQEIPEAFRRR